MSVWEENYVKVREKLLYYKYVRNLLSMCTINAESILDVGSGAVDVLSHCVNVKEKYSLDLRNPLSKEGIIGIKDNFLEYQFTRQFDIVTCFQVLEHIDDAKGFAQKLLQHAKQAVIVSVPYMWKKGQSIHHVQDPVDIDKLSGWFEMEPIFCEIVESRLIAVFLKNSQSREALFVNNGKNFSDYYKGNLSANASIGLHNEIPCDLLVGKKRIILYGAGNRGKSYFKQLFNQNEYEIVLWVDKNYKEYEKFICRNSSPDDISKVDYDVIVLAIKNSKVVEEVVSELKALGVSEEKMVWAGE